jgi:hypothetical protein
MILYASLSMNRDMEEGMDSLTNSDIVQFELLTNDFCKKSLSQFIDEHNPDGNFSILPYLIDEACSIGIITKAHHNASGYDYGIWGKQTLTSTDAIINSLSMLSVLASTCASFAFLAHIQGLAANVLIQSQIENNTPYPFLSFYNELLPPQYQALIHLPSNTLKVNNPFIAQLYGFGYNPCHAIVCLPDTSGWSMLYFDSVQTILLQNIKTHGLRGLYYKARFNSDITATIPVSNHTIELLFAFFWLGIAAISIGIAQSAYLKAFNYAHQRYQRGSVIKNIESVQMLLGSSKAKIETAKNTLFSFTAIDSNLLLKHAAHSKLTVTTMCSQVVTDCLQVFGGYGYMEDFGIEKKFRDINTLTTIGGSPFFMKQFIAQMEMEE